MGVSTISERLHLYLYSNLCLPISSYVPVFFFSSIQNSLMLIRADVT